MWKKRDDLVKLDVIAVEKIMKYRKITPYGLARIIIRDKKEVKLWLTGERIPTWASAHMIADALDCDMEHLTGEKPFVPDPEPETDSVPSADTSGSLGADANAKRTDKGLLGEIEVDANDLASWNAEQKDRFLCAIGDFLKLGCPVRLVGRPRAGSVRLALRLTREQWQRLEEAFIAGQLAHLKVTKVEPFYDLSEDEVGFADVGGRRMVASSTSSTNGSSFPSWIYSAIGARNTIITVALIGFCIGFIVGSVIDAVPNFVPAQTPFIEVSLLAGLVGGILGVLMLYVYRTLLKIIHNQK